MLFNQINFIVLFIIVRSFVLILTRNNGSELKNSAEGVGTGCGMGDYLRSTRGASVLLYTKRPPSCSAFAAKRWLRRCGTGRMIGEEIIVRDGLVGRGGSWEVKMERHLSPGAPEGLLHTKMAKAEYVPRKYPPILLHPSKRSHHRLSCNGHSSVV